MSIFRNYLSPRPAEPQEPKDTGITAALLTTLINRQDEILRRLVRVETRLVKYLNHVGFDCVVPDRPTEERTNLHN